MAGQERDTAGDLLDRLEGGARRHPENDPVTHQETAHPPRSRQGEHRQRRQLENLLHHGGDHYGCGCIGRGDAGGAADPQTHHADQQRQRHPGGEHPRGQCPGDGLGPSQGEPAHHQPQAPDPGPQRGTERRRDHHGHNEDQQREPGRNGPHSAQRQEDPGPRRTVSQPLPPLLPRRCVCPRSRSGCGPRPRCRRARHGHSARVNRCRYRLRRPGGPLGGPRFGSSAGDRHAAMGSRLRSVDRTIVWPYCPIGRGWSTPVGRGGHDPVCRRGDVAVTRCRFSRRRTPLLLRTARPAPGCRPDPGWLHPRRLFGARFRHIAIAVTAHRSRLSRDTVCFRNHFVTFG